MSDAIISIKWTWSNHCQYSAHTGVQCKILSRAWLDATYALPWGSICIQHPSCSESTCERELCCCSCSPFQDIDFRGIWGIKAWGRPQWRRPPQNLLQSFVHAVGVLCIFPALLHVFVVGWVELRWAVSHLLRGQPATMAKSQLWVIKFGAHDFMCLVRAAFYIYLHQVSFVDLLPRHLPCKDFLQLFSWPFMV